MPLKWNNDLSVGNSEIDLQHKYLIELGSKISELDVNNAKQIAMELFKYTREHFSKEEAHMKLVGYDGLSEHKIIHEDLIEGLDKITEHQLNSEEDVKKFKKFFAHWIVNHIMIEDMQYAKLGKSK